MTPDDPGVLVEAAITAYRERDREGRIRPSPAWADLAPAEREVLFEAQAIARSLEAALDDDGMSSTARVVLGRARGIEQERGGV